MASTRRLRGAVRSPSAVAAPARRDRVLIASCIALITALAWAYLVQLDHQMSPSVGHGAMMETMGMPMDEPWSARELFFAFVMWAVMMVGMMTAPAAPVLLVFAGSQARRSGRGVPLAVLLFGLGYLAVWLGFSAFAAVAQGALHRAALLSPGMSTWSTPLAGGILVVAGAYQFTSLKARCLVQCRSPLGFLMGHWREGRIGAFRMGLGHGVYCLGCCWALMGVLFVVGVMNLAWVGILSVFVLVEKIAPHGVQVARLSGAVLIAFGVILSSRWL